MTIAYPNGKPIDFFDIMLGLTRGCTINVHYRIFDVCDIPTNNQNQLQNWAYKLYQEKDRLLEKFYQTGQFLNKNECFGRRESRSDYRQIKHMKWKYYFFNVFYLLSLISFGYLFTSAFL